MTLRILNSIYRIHNSKCLCKPKAFSLPKFESRLPTQLHKRPLNKNEKTKKLKFYVFNKYVQFFKACTNVIQRRFPKVVFLYRLFVDGTRAFLVDFREYISLVRALNFNGKCLKDLTRVELELYEQMPKDVRRVAPVLLFSLFPLAYYVIFPLIYLFPRQILCRHFWNLQQKSEFGLVFMRKRIAHNKPILRHLQLQLKGLHGSFLHKRWSNVLGQLGSGVHPTPEQIIECKDLFVNGPYHLMYLSRNHVVHLLKIHELHSGWYRRTRLGDRAIILKAMDSAIVQEGGIQGLQVDALKHACSIRGLNPMNMRNEDMAKWLSQWILVSENVDEDSLSLLLHCPILLAYNQPSNWRLIYPSKINPC